MSHPTARFALLSAPAVDGGAGEPLVLLRRALSRPAARAADHVVVLGDLTAHGAAHEREALARALRPARGRLTPLAGPADLPRLQAADARAWADAVGDAAWPRRVEVADGACVLFALDTARLDGGRDAVGAKQLAALEESLAALPPDRRKVVALYHDPRPPGLLRGRAGKPLIDQKDLAALVTKHGVDLVLHGQTPHLLRAKLGPAATVGAPPLVGDAATGQRLLLDVALNLDDGTVTVDRDHVAAPADRPDLIEAFATSDAMRAWVALAEKAYDAEDTFAAFARAFEDRAARLEMVDAVSADLDDRLAALLRRADADPDALPAPLRDLLMLPTPESTDV
ncbi:MAG: metallophosphoesterase [Myxococcales bacterium]|nr:metallophosphoesterase [Myxococcales bacterium]